MTCGFNNRPTYLHSSRVPHSEKLRLFLAKMELRLAHT